MILFPCDIVLSQMQFLVDATCLNGWTTLPELRVQPSIWTEIVLSNLNQDITSQATRQIHVVLRRAA